MTADPELKKTPTGIPVTTFNIAVNRRFGEKGKESQADFFTVTAWRQTAEFVCKFFRKASSICVVGSLQTRTWTDNNGQKHYATEIVADEAHFVDAKNEMPGQTAAGAAYSPAGEQNATAGVNIPPQTNAAPQGMAYAPQGDLAPAPKFEQLSDDDELPF